MEQTGKTYIVEGKKIKARKKTNNKWFETQDSIKYWDDFSKQKIVWGNLCLSAQFAMASEEYFINAPSPMLVPGDYYLLAVMNSKLADWYIRQLGVTRNGGYFEYKPMFVEQLPVPILDEKNPLKSKFSKKAQLLEISNSKVINDEINQMVYELYGLSSDEIYYVDNLEK